MPLSDIVNVQIDVQSQAVPQQSFGIPMILGTSKSFVDLLRQYSSMRGVAVDFTPQQPEYIAANAIFSQVRSPTSIYIGRRNANVATIDIVSPQSPATYTVNINNLTATVDAATTTQTVTVALSTAYNAGNLTNVVFNDVTLGTINSVIDFSGNFVASNSIVATVNGVPLAPVVFTTDQATTIAALAAALAAAPGITGGGSATVTATTQITVVFAAAGANTVDSVITTLGASQPTATISQGGFPYVTDSATTLGTVRTALLLQPNVSAVLVSGNSLIITSVAGTVNTMNTYAISIGTLPTVTITNDSRADAIGRAMVAAINGLVGISPIVASYVGTPDGRFTVTGDNTIPYTLSVSSTIQATTAAFVQITDVSPNALYSLNVKGETYEVQTDTSVQSAEQIAALMVAEINLNSANSGVTATDNLDGTFTVQSSNTFFIQGNADQFSITIGLRVLPYVATDAIATTLAAMRAASTGWYGLILTDRTKATVQSAATWVEGDKSTLFITASNESAIINTTPSADTSSLAWFLQNSGYVRTAVLYHQDADTDFPDAAWMGLCFTYDPGSETWKFKNLKSQSTSNLTTTQSFNALGKNANTYEFVGGVGITQNGTSGQGEFLDITRGSDWLKSNIQNLVYTVLVNNQKVPYTDGGIALIQSQVQRALQQAVDQNFLSDDPAPIVTVPLAASVPSIDKANRVLRNVNFTGTLAGAIHSVIIQGTLSV